jgi:hypothetical protein
VGVVRESPLPWMDLHRAKFVFFDLAISLAKIW